MGLSGNLCDYWYDQSNQTVTLRAVSITDETSYRKIAQSNPRRLQIPKLKVFINMTEQLIIHFSVIEPGLL